ncbi:head-tail connector protein [Alloyangia pacifica]|uniref:Phage gp6-like head-tail connector protein n=1 Tax=Alloyangia pacifica TaxID=311180 RepID=A0A1I6QJB2_9RHOB|nr:hypothetical protein [Alloyangia pacifica]SDF91346.1 phage conserved hypothetical protein, phiE125 gp8 family [Alloyangia pacifica]SFS52587.1 phage conserved hypothetical protein, phiE125 gp8 family [Alloyangia pacifica]
MFRPTLITPPAGKPVGATECKSHAVVDYSEDDAIVEAMIDAAVSHFDGFRGVLGRAIILQTWQVEMGAWQRCVDLPVPDVSAVTITYADAAGEQQDGPNVRILATSGGTRVVLPNNWSFPATETGNPAPISIQFTCGFGDASAVPSAIKMAIMQMVAHMFAEREGISIAEPVYDRLIAPWRWARL